MAVYRFSAVIVKRSAGRSATAAAAYRAAERIVDERTGLTHDYRRRSGVEHTEILAPDSAPEWMRDRAALWNAVERIERRKDAQLSREIQLALPHELDERQRIELVRAFVREQFVDKGMVADLAIHAPDRAGDNRNHHAHVMLTLRELLGEGFGPKQRAWNETVQLEQWRESWAEHANRALERAGSKERVDHRSLEAQGLDREPEPKLGPHASEMERRGQASERGDERRKVWARNQLREELRREAGVVDLAIERERRRLAGERAPDQAPPTQAERERQARERQQAYEKERFEGWANRRRAELQNRQLDDKGDLGRRHYEQRESLSERLAATYGPGIAAARRTLAEVEARERAGRALRFVYRLSGQARRDHDQAEAARANLADAQARMAEQRGKLDHAQEAERTAQGAAHRRQVRALEERIGRAYERREREGWQPLPPRSPANDRDAPERQQDRTNETPWQRVQRLRAELRERERQQGRGGRDFERDR